jgi:hypothetical protein
MLCVLQKKPEEVHAIGEKLGGWAPTVTLSRRKSTAPSISRCSRSSGGRSSADPSHLFNQTREEEMSVFVIGGTGFIGHRLARLLIARGQTVTCMDINLSAHSFADLGDKLTFVRGDVTQFDVLMAAMAAAKPERVVNLSYFIGSDHAPHVAMKLNILGMDNCFEAARLLGVKHTLYASSLAVNGKQANYGNRPITEED